MGFFLFILVNASLFIRPIDLFPALLGIPIYEGLILSCLLVSGFAVLGELAPSSLAKNSISACALCLLASMLISNLAHFRIDSAIDSGIEFAKVLLYYFLLIGLLDSFARLRSFLLWLGLIVLIVASLALLHYYHIINIPSLVVLEHAEEEIDEETGEHVVLARLQSVGIYNNPNDLSRILVVGILISLYFLGNRCFGLLRVLWLLPMILFGHGLQLTHSRGGLLSLLGGLFAFLLNGFGTKKSLVLSVLVLPAVMFAFAGRQTEMSTSEGTAQQRIKIWNDGFVALRSSPVFGIGMNQHQEELGIVAHNSFVHCYVELGIVGGMFFFAMFYLPAKALQSKSRCEPSPRDPDVIRLRALVFALLVATAVGMFSSSRSYTVPSYLIVGLCASYLRVLSDRGQTLLPRFDLNLIRRLMLASTLTLVGLYAYVRLMARY